MEVQMTPCPHCGEAVTEAQGVCPNCGALLHGVWPPPPHGYASPSSPLRPKTLTRRIWTDFVLGATGQYLTHLAAARVLIRYVPTTSHSQDWFEQVDVPGGFVLTEMFWAILFGLLTYYGLRRLYPIVARGSGYTTIVLLVILLGAFFTCRPLLY